MNQYDQLSLLDESEGIFKKAATVASKLIFNANQTGSFASSLTYSLLTLSINLKKNARPIKGLLTEVY